MAIELKHKFTSPKADGPDSTIVQPSDWNDSHDITLATGKLVGRSTAGTGAAEEITPSANLALSGGTLDLAANAAITGNFQADGSVSAGGAPSASAQLTVTSTTKGFLGPRMTTVQRDAIAAPATGLEIFNTALGVKQVWTGSAWDSLSIGAYGVGVTGDAPLISDLDSSTTPAGIYRFDGTTIGTYPGGVTAGDTGAVELWRQTALLAMMEMHHAVSDRVFRRRMTAGTWGTWREVINVNQATVEGDVIYRGPSSFNRLAKGTAGQVLQMNPGATAPEWVTPVFSKAFASSQQTITGGGLLTLAHSLGVAPKLISAYLVCQTAELGYAVNDQVEVSLVVNSTAGNTRANGVYFDATNVYVRFFNGGGVFTIANKTTGNTSTITDANWKLVVRAYA